MDLGIFISVLSANKNLPSTGMSVPVCFGLALTKTTNRTSMKQLRMLQKRLRDQINYSSTRIPKPSLISREKPLVLEHKQWLGIDHCSGCQCQNDHCFCIFEPHSGTPNDTMIKTIAGKSDYENVKFSDQIDPYMVDIDTTVDPTRRLQDSNDATLDNFFSRPLKIFSTEWATSTVLAEDFDPWSLYFNNKRVSNRISNYNLLRCNLRIKVVINGNGFQYGRAMVAYLPFDKLDDLSTNSALLESDLVGTSQLPHIFLDPTTSTGGEMRLPNFNHHNYISIPTTQWEDLGQLYIRSLNTLKHANGASDVVTISVFAWAEDVAMSVLTSVDPTTLSPQMGKEVHAFEPQSGETEEANKTGMISGPATAVAKWTSYLTKVPYIGPFAMATSMAANTTSAIAKMFGYCRPAVTKNPEPYRPTPMSSLALTNVPDTAQKLTVDGKQELSIDPRIAGLGGVDSMNIREIAKRESYIGKFSWPIGTPPEQLLWNSRVSPVLWAEDSQEPISFHFPACAMAALPFQYWTGSMKFRFQVVCSTFHKGRLKFVYDPNFLASSEYNTNYISIVDIADEQDFTIEVGMGQDKTLISHSYPGEDAVSTITSTTPYSSKGPGNGVIGVYVVNELTTPNSDVNNDIEINVFVSMGDDFEVFVPEDYFQQFVFKHADTDQNLSQTVAENVALGLQVESERQERKEAERKARRDANGLEQQSGSELTPESQNTSEPSAPAQTQSTIVGLGPAASPDINKVFIGEAIASFRTMLKRYHVWSVIGSHKNDSTLVYGRYGHFPYLRGGVAGAVDRTSKLRPYNYCNTVLLHWVRNAFQGWRGSIRYKMIPRGKLSSNDYIQVQRAALKQNAPQYFQFQANSKTYNTRNLLRQSVINKTPQSGLPFPHQPLSGYNGTAITFNHVNGVLEFEMPWYSNDRFEPGKPQSYTGQMKYSSSWDYNCDFGGGKTTALDLYVAAGEDFQVYFFTGLPRMYYERFVPF